LRKKRLAFEKNPRRGTSVALLSVIDPNIGPKLRHTQKDMEGT
jgi:hypothetical protein